MADFDEGKHARDEHGKFAASASEKATAATAEANLKGTRAAHGRAAAAHSNAANAHVTAARAEFEKAGVKWPGPPVAETKVGTPERAGAEHVEKVHEHLKEARVHELAVRENKNAAKAVAKTKPTVATPLNVSALADHVMTHGGGKPEFTNRVESTSASHIRRAASAGLVEHASPTSLRLTAAGHAAVMGHLKKEATRLTNPAYNRPEDNTRREQVANAIKGLSAAPPKKDHDDRYDAAFSGVDHPRDEHGRFASGDTQGATDKANAATKAAKGVKISKDPSGYGMVHERAAAAHREAAGRYTPEIAAAQTDLERQKLLHPEAQTQHETAAKVASMKVAQAQHEMLAAQHSAAAERGRKVAVKQAAKAPAPAPAVATAAKPFAGPATRAAKAAPAAPAPVSPARIEAARQSGAARAYAGSTASAFNHSEWGPTIGFHQRGEVGTARAYTTANSMEEAKAYAEGHNAKAREYEKRQEESANARIAAKVAARATTVSGGVPGRPQTSGKNTAPRGIKAKIEAAKANAQPGDHPALAARMVRYPVGAKVTTAAAGQMFVGGGANAHYGSVVGHDRTSGKIRVQFENGSARAIDPKAEGLSRVLKYRGEK